VAELALAFPLLIQLLGGESPWLELAPPELRERRIPIPDHENAYPLWLQAIRPLDEKLDQGLNDSIRDACKEDSSFPAGETGRKLEEWLAGHQEALDLADRGLARGRFQFPDWYGRKDFEEVLFPFFYPGSMLYDLRVLRAKLLASRDDLRGAAEELRRLLRSAELLQDGGGSLIIYLTGTLRQVQAYQGIRRLARREGVPASLLEDLLSLLGPSEREGERPAECVRAEFARFFLPLTVEAAPESADLRTLALAFAGELEGKKREDFVQGFCALLEGHPLPFDRKETVILGARRFAYCLKNLKVPWGERNVWKEPSLEEVARSWPSQLRPYQTGISPEEEALSTGKLDEARKALARIRNPLGKSLLAGGPFPKFPTKRLFRVRTDREATRAVLALRVYALRRGRLPDGLEALVEEKILPALPADHFSGKPLAYSREKRLLWSVGPDGKEDGRSGLRKADGSRKEDVFEVPGEEPLTR
jgi:hypothetical protein